MSICCADSQASKDTGVEKGIRVPLLCRLMAMMRMLMLMLACMIRSFAHKNEKMRRDDIAGLCDTITAPLMVPEGPRLLVHIEKAVEKSRL